MTWPEAWIRLRATRLSDPELSAEEKPLLTSSTVTDLINELQQLDQAQYRESRPRRWLNTLQPLIKGLQCFGKALDTLSNGDPHGILSLVWGSLRIVLGLAQRYQDVFEEMAEFFEEVAHPFERLQIYDALYKQDRLSDALYRVFEAFLEFVVVVQNGLRRTEHAKLRDKIGAKLKKTAFWLDLQDKLHGAVSKVSRLCESGEREAQLAASLDNAQFQQKASQHAEVAEIHAFAIDRRAIGQWLNPVQTLDDLRAAQVKARGTCGWIDDEEEFISWLEPESNPTSTRLLWVKGMPGCGKTCLTTRIIEKAKATATTAFFFCNTGDIHKRTCLPILGTLAWQLLQEKDELFPIVQTVFNTGEQPSVYAMAEILQSFLSIEPSFRIVLDGLDECEPTDRHQMLEIVGRLAQSCKVAILSRDIEGIADPLTKISRSVKYGSIHILESHNKDDIEIFVRRRVDEDFISLGLSAILLDTIFHTLAEGAHGMFLWVKLMIDRLAAQTSVKNIKMALNTLPDGLNQTYEGILEQSPDKDMAKQLLRWITCASRPLTVRELNYAITVEPGELGLDLECLTLRPKETFRNVLGPLIEIDESETVKFIHASVKDFLSGPSSRSSRVSAFFVETAIRARMACEIMSFLSDDGPIRLAYFKEHPLLTYSTGNWWTHVRNSSGQNKLLPEELQNDLLKFSSGRPMITRWAQILRYCIAKWETLDPAHQILQVLDTFEARLSIRAESYHGCLKHLYGDSESSTASALAWLLDTRGLPYFHTAAILDFDDILEAHLRLANVHPDSIRAENGMTALHAAAMARSWSAIRTLLRLGAAVNATTTRGDSVFNCALLKHTATTNRWSSANSRTFECARFLLGAGADLRIRYDTGENALWVMTKNWPADDEYALNFLEELLSQVDAQTINVFGSYKRTILYNAVSLASSAMIKLLLQYGALPDGAFANRWDDGPKRGSPLSFAASLRALEITQILLAAGANPNYQAPLYQRTPLHEASTGSDEIVKSLLRRGADTKIPDIAGWVPLHHAAVGGHVAIVQRLLDHDGSCLGIKNREGKTPLGVAIMSRADHAIQAILQYIFEHEVNISETSQTGLGDIFIPSTKPKPNLIDVAKIIDDEISVTSTTNIQQTPNSTLTTHHPCPC